MNPDDNVMGIATSAEDVISVTQAAKISEVLSVMLNRGIRRIPVTKNYYGDLCGIISTTDMLDYLGAGPRYDLFSENREQCLDITISKIMETRVLSLDKKSSIKDAIEKMVKHKVGSLPIVDNGRLTGFVSEYDIVKNISGRLGMKVDDVMVRKVFFVKDCSTLLEVAKMMVNGPYRRLPVVNDRIIVGIVTPYDILNFLNLRKDLRGMRVHGIPISNVMNTNLVCVRRDDGLHKAVDAMNKYRIGGLPVVEAEEMDLVGIISENDVVGLLG